MNYPQCEIWVYGSVNECVGVHFVSERARIFDCEEVQSCG